MHDRVDRIGLVTDSSSQIPADLAERFSVEVVPLTVTIDGVDHAEGVDLDADGFYAHFADGALPAIVTSQPSPGAFAEVYQRLADQGCSEIVSVHLAESMSGTVASASLASADSAAPVHVIDTGAASFGVSVCVWAAGRAIETGASAAEVRARVELVVPTIGTAFMVGVPLLTERGGRATDVDLFESDEGIPVLVMQGGQLDVFDRVTSIEDTIDVMATYAGRWGSGTTVAIGTADQPSRALTERLERVLGELDDVDEVVHYRIGPSIGAHTGPGTFGLFVFPTIA